jgi:heme oxygenase (biliverdin-IX-beta and delta-forming)
MKKISAAREALRQATGDVHQQLEQSLTINQPEAGKREYLEYLEDLRGWMASFEAALWRAPWPVEMEARERAGKLAWIDSDLRASGMSDHAIQAIPMAGFTPDLASLPARFGVAYVIEGAQLGTRVLGKALAPGLHPWSPRWLEGYGDQNAKRWRVFIDCLEHYLTTDEARRVAAAAAREAFISLADWFAARRLARETVGGETW